MNRREFLKHAGLIAAGAVAADQLELLDRLGWRRRFFPGFTKSDPYFITKQFTLGFLITQEMIEDDVIYPPPDRLFELVNIFDVKRSEMLDGYLILPKA